MVVYLTGWERSRQATERLEALKALCVQHGHEATFLPPNEPRGTQAELDLMSKSDAALVNVGLLRGAAHEIRRDVESAVSAKTLVLLHYMPEKLYCSDECGSIWPMCDQLELAECTALGWQLSDAMHESWRAKYGESSPFPITEGRPFRCPASCLRAMAWVQRHVDAKNAKEEGRLHSE